MLALCSAIPQGLAPPRKANGRRKRVVSNIWTHKQRPLRRGEPGNMSPHSHNLQTSDGNGGHARGCIIVERHKCALPPSTVCEATGRSSQQRILLAPLPPQPQAGNRHFTQGQAFA